MPDASSSPAASFAVDFAGSGIQSLPQHFLDVLAKNVGGAATLIFPDPFRWGDGAVARWHGKILSTPLHNGYLTPGGGWAFSGTIPSHCLLFLSKGKRKPRHWRIDDLLAIEIDGKIIADRRDEMLRRQSA